MGEDLLPSAEEWSRRIALGAEPGEGALAQTPEIEDWVASLRQKSYSPNQLQADADMALLLHAKEAYRRFGKQYRVASTLAHAKSTEQLIAEAQQAMAKAYEERTADDYAALEKHRVAQAGENASTDTTRRTLGVLASIGNVLDWGTGSRPLRMMGWATVPKERMGGRTAYEESAKGHAENLLALGMNKWAAIPLGILLEAPDPLWFSGLGIGLKATTVGGELAEGSLKGLARTAGREFAEAALKAGRPLPGTPMRLGLFTRSFAQLSDPKAATRVLRGIPFTEKIGTWINARLNAVGSRFAKAGTPSEGLLRALYNITDDQAAQASYALNRAMRPFVDELTSLKLTPEAQIRAQMAAEYIGRIGAGDNVAQEALERLTYSPKEKMAASLIQSAWSRAKRVVDDLGLNYPKSEEEFAKQLKMVNEDIIKFAKTNKGDPVQLLASAGLAEPEQVSGVVKAFETEIARQEALVRQTTQKSLLRLEPMVQAGEEFEPTLRAAQKSLIAKEEKLAGEMVGRMKKQHGGKAPATTTARTAGDIADTAERLAAAQQKAAPGSLEGLIEEAERQTPLVTRPAKLDMPGSMQDPLVKTKTARQAIAQYDKAATNYGILSDAVDKLDRMTVPELEQTLRKALPYTKIADKKSAMYELWKLDRERVIAYSRAEKYRQAAAGIISGNEAVAKSKELENLLTRAAQVDYAWKTTPDYVGRRVREGVWEEALPLKKEPTITVEPHPLAKSGAYKKRVWRHESGRELYLDEMEQQMRRAIYDPEFLNAPDNSHIREYLNAMFGTTHTDDAVKKAREWLELGVSADERLARQIASATTPEELAKRMEAWSKRMKSAAPMGAEEQRAFQAQMRERLSFGSVTERGAEPVLMSKYFSLDPQGVIKRSFATFVSDLQKQEMVKGLRMLASDIADPAHTLSAKELATKTMRWEIRQQFEDKWFPKELLDDLRVWRKNLKQVVDKPNKVMQAFDAWQSLWKYQATRWPPFSFEFRNWLSDNMRAMVESPFNPLETTWIANRALTGSDELMDMGSIGKISGKDLKTLAESMPGVTMGYADEVAGRGAAAWVGQKLPVVGAALGKLGRAKQKVVNALWLNRFGENGRRIGFFGHLLRKGHSPIDAARIVKKAFFDYSELAAWEKVYAKRIFPWWTFRRKNLGFQLEKLFTQPYYAMGTLRPFLRSRERVNTGMPDELRERLHERGIPERFRGRLGIFYQNQGVTEVMAGFGFDSEDLLEVLDATGHPAGAFAGAIETITDDIGPFAQELGRMLTPEAWKAWKVDADAAGLVRAPMGVEKLPEGIRNMLGITKTRRMIKGKYATREEWYMPAVTRERMKLLRVWNETLRFLRVRNSPTVSEDNFNSLAALLTGVTAEEIQPEQWKAMMLRERMLDLQRTLRKNGMLIGHDLTLEGIRTPLGREYLRTRALYIGASIRRSVYEEKLREERAKAKGLR